MYLKIYIYSNKSLAVCSDMFSLRFIYSSAYSLFSDLFSRMQTPSRENLSGSLKFHARTHSTRANTHTDVI